MVIRHATNKYALPHTSRRPRGTPARRSAHSSEAPLLSRSLARAAAPSMLELLATRPGLRRALCVLLSRDFALFGYDIDECSGSFASPTDPPPPPSSFSVASSARSAVPSPSLGTAASFARTTTTTAPEEEATGHPDPERHSGAAGSFDPDPTSSAEQQTQRTRARRRRTRAGPRRDLRGLPLQRPL